MYKFIKFTSLNKSHSHKSFKDQLFSTLNHLWDLLWEILFRVLGAQQFNKDDLRDTFLGFLENFKLN